MVIEVRGSSTMLVPRYIRSQRSVVSHVHTRLESALTDLAIFNPPFRLAGMLLGIFIGELLSREFLLKINDQRRQQSDILWRKSVVWIIHWSIFHHNRHLNCGKFVRKTTACRSTFIFFQESEYIRVFEVRNISIFSTLSAPTGRYIVANESIETRTTKKHFFLYKTFYNFINIPTRRNCRDNDWKNWGKKLLLLRDLYYMSCHNSICTPNFLKLLFLLFPKKNWKEHLNIKLFN